MHQALPSEFTKTLKAYRGLETLLGDGKVRATGVSKFVVDHLTALLDRASVVPAVNQIEGAPRVQPQLLLVVLGRVLGRHVRHRCHLHDQEYTDLLTVPPARLGAASWLTWCRPREDRAQ